MTSTISNNSASVNGGGLTNNGAVLDINASTIVENNADSNGGGIDAINTVLLKNTIVAMNTSASGTDVSGAITSNNYNLIGFDDLDIFTAQANDLEGVDPLLGSLQNNGGTTQTHQLLDDSPAYNAGDPSDLFVDQIGQALFGDTRDIGSLEAQMSLSLEGFNLLSDLSLYPNPTQGQFNISYNDTISGKINVQIFSLSGKLIKQTVLENENNSVNLNGILSGIYLVKVSSNESQVTKKLIVK